MLSAQSAKLLSEAALNKEKDKELNQVLACIEMSTHNGDTLIVLRTEPSPYTHKKLSHLGYKFSRDKSLRTVISWENA